MIQELDSQLTRMDIINSIKEKYVGENCRMEYLSGGILNSANNNEPSIIRLFDDTNSYVLKIATKNSNVEEYLLSFLQGAEYSQNNVKTIIDQILNFFPKSKEIYAYSLLQELNIKSIPRVFFLGIQELTEQTYILIEDLSNNHHFNAFSKNEIITFDEIIVFVRDLAKIHNLSYNNLNSIKNIPTINYNAIIDHKKYFEEIVSIVYKKYNSTLESSFFEFLFYSLNNIEKMVNVLNTGFFTLTHNDCNTRNSCFQKQNNELVFVLYDWDICRIQNPQFDLIEYLLFLANKICGKELTRIIEKYIQEVNFIDKASKQDFINSLENNVMWYTLYKFCIYAVIDDFPETMIKKLSNRILYYNKLIKSI